MQKYLPFSIPVSVFPALGHILKFCGDLPKTRLRASHSRRVGEAIGGGWMDGRTERHSTVLWRDFLAECPSPPWSMEQSVYCKVGPIPGEEEKRCLVMGGELTLSSLWQLGGLDRSSVIGSSVGFKGERGLHARNSNDSGCIFQCRVAGSWQVPLLLMPPPPR